MSELSAASEEKSLYRCPVCDSVVAVGAVRCLMCGATFTAVPPTPSPTPPPPIEPDPIQSVPPLPEPPPVAQTLEFVEKVVASPQPETAVFTSVMHERQSPAVVILTAVFTLFIFIIGYLVWQYQDTTLVIALAPTVTPLPPTPSYTPTITPQPSNTPRPSDTPTITPTPGPTDTARPPRLHIVSAGDTLIGLALFYQVSPDSIASQNSFSVDTPIQLSQQLVIPWPTATPPLVSIGKEVNGELVIADPANCDRYTVQSGDSLSAIAGRFGVDYELFRDVNRLNDETILQPGDTVCIPVIVFGGTLPPTPGPSPTPTLTPPPAGPQLLYPINHATIEPPDTVLRLQWVAVKNLLAAEWYMVELTNLAELDALPYRGFTRDTSFVVPSTWRPTVPENQQMRWRVTIVLVTDFRSDGRPIYTFGGRSSADAFFTWLGAIPTPTPTLTATATPTPEE